MKFIALGSNLNSARGGPAQNIHAAAVELKAQGFQIIARAPLYQSAAEPPSDQADFINTVLQAEWGGTPEEALARCMEVEAAMGRVRGVRNEARIIDIDIIAWDGAVQSGSPELPHPRMQDRAFVLWPLCDIAPDWRHPVLGRSALELKNALTPSDIHLNGEQW